MVLYSAMNSGFIDTHFDIVQEYFWGQMILKENFSRFYFGNLIPA